MPGQALLARVDGLGSISFRCEAFRHVSPGLDPLATVGARVHGGRWNPPGRFGAVYLGLDLATVAEEFHRAAAAQNLAPEAFLPRDLHRLRVRLGAVLDLRDAVAAAALGLGQIEIRGSDRRACQAVGDAAHYLGLEGILAPSATGSGVVLAVFADRLGAESMLESIAVETWVAPPRRGTN